MELDDLAETIDRLVGSDPSSYADTEPVEALQRQLTRLHGFVTATAAFDVSGAWAPDGARNAAAWLATRCRLPKAQARSQVRRGRALRHLPVCAQAWLDGDIGAAHVDVLTAVRRDATEEALGRDEEMLVGQARRLRHESFVRAVAHWGQLADPAGTEEDDEARRSRRLVYLEESFQAMWLGKITLDPISGTIVATELERLERELFEADWAAARSALGRDPTVLDLARTSGQRRADALVEMATRSRSAPADGHRPAPLFSVLVGYETLHGPICSSQAARCSPRGRLFRGWTRPTSSGPCSAGRRVEVSATARLFTGATRRAIELRDRGCIHPYCDTPAAACQGDHIVPYNADGPTTQENGRLLCSFHNRLRNQRPPPAA